MLRSAPGDTEGDCARAFGYPDHLRARGRPHRRPRALGARLHHRTFSAILAKGAFQCLRARPPGNTLDPPPPSTIYPCSKHTTSPYTLAGHLTAGDGNATREEELVIARPVDWPTPEPQTSNSRQGNE